MQASRRPLARLAVMMVTTPTAVDAPGTSFVLAGW